MSLIIWHNPRCSKSRQTLALIEEKGLQPTVRLYLEDVPSVGDIKKTLETLNISARELMRKGEADYKEQNLKEETDEAALAQAMHNFPKLIERPIVFSGNKAAIGRPPESVLDIL